MSGMTWEERWKRDGSRWRYIYLLEQELEARKTRQIFIWLSTALNIILICALAWVLL